VLILFTDLQLLNLVHIKSPLCEYAFSVIDSSYGFWTYLTVFIPEEYKRIFPNNKCAIVIFNSIYLLIDLPYIL